MPVIDIQGPDGKVIEVLHRSNEPLPKGYKKLFPTRISVTGFRQPESMPEKVMRGYHRLECREGSRFHSMHSTKQIKKAWGI